MTLIEFFDKVPLENIAGAMICKPERVIFIGDNGKQMERSIEVYQRILTHRGYNIEMIYRTVNKNKLDSILGVLEGIAQSYGDCVFDLTGGEDLLLVALGMIMNKYGNRVQCHRFNFRNSTLLDCDADGNLCSTQSFDISIEEFVIACGGKIVRGDDGFGGITTFEWSYDEEFCEDIEKMWQICRADARLWNCHLGTLGRLDELFGDDDTLSVCVEKSRATEIMKSKGYSFAFINGIMQALEHQGIISDFRHGEMICYTYKNDQIRRCLTVAGQVLELAMALRLKRLKEDSDTPLYHDIQVGVVMDWDGYRTDDIVRTVNEIDIIAMKDAIPIFISCKNGNFDVEELYKLNTVAERFGTQYVRKALIASELDKLGSKADFIRARAQDMKIKLIEDVDMMSDAKLEKILYSLWRS